MKTHVFWRLFSAAVLTAVVWNAMGLGVYGGWNDSGSGSGGTLLDVFRGRGSSSKPTPAITVTEPTPSSTPMAMPAPQMTPVPAQPMTTVPVQQAPVQQMTPVPVQQNGYEQSFGNTSAPRGFPNGQYIPPKTALPQPTSQNKWSLKNLFTGSTSNHQPQPQYVGSAPPAPPLIPSSGSAPTPAYNPPHSHAPQPVMASGQIPQQYPVVPLDSEDFRPLEGAVYNEKGEMIYSPESGGVMPNFADGEMMYDNNGGNVVYDGAGNNVVYDNNSGNNVIYDNNEALPIIEPEDPGVKRIISGNRNGTARPSASVNQERVYGQTPVYPNNAVSSTPQPIPAQQMQANPYAHQPSAGVGNSPVGTGNPNMNGNSGALNLGSGSTAFSKTYKPGPVRTNVPAEPVMDMAGPELTEALPQLGTREQRTGNGSLPSANLTPAPSPVAPQLQPTPNPAIGASAPTASPVIEDIHNASPLENLSEKSSQTPVLEPVPESVPESVPEIDVPKEKLGSRQEAMKGGNEVSEANGITHSPTGELANSQPQVGNSDNTQSAPQEPLATRNSPLATPQTDNKQETVDSNENTQSAPQSSLATRNSQPSMPPLVIEIDGPDEVEFGKNEMFSLSVINTTDAIRRDVVLSVHPEGFGSDKTASITLEQLAPNEKKSIYMKLNARQYNNLSLTAQVRDALGFETTKSISVNVKNESVKISILPPQAGTAFVGQPTQYIVRIVNNADNDVSLSAMAFFGNGIEPIRASGAPNTIQSGQVVVNKPIELKRGEMRDLKIIAVAFQPGIHKILIQLIDSRGATYAAKESCAYRQREFDDNVETVETDARIELTPGKSEIGVWKAASASPSPAVGNNGGSRQEAVGSSDSPTSPAANAPDAVPLTQPDQGPRGDLIMPMFAQ